MKRLLFVVLGACAIALLAMVGVAAADGGPHGGYAPTADGCAGCHRAHTADAPKLLTNPIGSLCYSCHGTTATGADTNVQDGVYLERDGVTEPSAEGVADRGLKGGGFTNALMDTSFDAAAPTSGATTSAHNHDDIITGTAWGNGAINAVADPGATGFALGCTDCHDPHGNGNYRILRPIPTDSGSVTVVNVTDETTKTYTITDPGGQYFSEGYNLAGDAFSDQMTTQYQELSDWCTQCHTRYLAAPDSATTDSGDAIFAYRHMAGSRAASCGNCHTTPPTLQPGITFNGTYWNHDVECATCHVAHGTSAVMTGDGPYSGSVEWPDGTTAVSGDARSSLLRVDNRGVCQACHNKPGTPAPAP